jgi:lantibiotic modifying enzyme
MRAAKIDLSTEEQERRVLAKRLVAPITTFARQELVEKIPAHHRAQLSSAAERTLFEWLEKRLADALTQCAELHFRAFVAFAGSSRREHDIARLAVDYVTPCAKRLLQLIEANPPLGKVLTTLVQHWLAAVGELLERFARDRRVLAKHFRVGGAGAKIRGLRIGLSDPKAGGRSVMELTFNDGGRIVYKPRDVLGEVDWFSLLNWANEEGWEPPLRIVRALARDGYGWLEGIRHLPCHARSEVRRYYYRSGGLLCLMHISGMTDCHQENVIALGAHPVLVDAETLGSFATSEDHQASCHKVTTIFRTGYLPVPTEVDPLAIDYSWSALDPMLQRNGDNLHLPRLNDQFLSSEDFTAEIVQGFRAMTNLVWSNRVDRKLKDHLSRIARCHPRRVLFRNTRTYVQIMEASLAPDVMLSGVTRSAKLIRLIWRKDIDPIIARQEFLALSQLDIPFFPHDGSRDHRALASKKTIIEDILKDLPAQLQLLKLALSKR